ncbi:triple tyrosine motif-containing protein [Psychroserpens sp. XS_ASV72]|uniref:helix-turn-helix and ligand-binding sensor domain-containing protein n=1 Tax=Psychroserpens sp. XS_ASV72 TaxID=3241293 RepID=UPI0035178F5F
MRTFLFYIASFWFSFISAQEIPPINVFSESEYDAESQNWSISQDSQKSIYVANNNGLLKFDGERWHLYPSPNNTIIRSVKVLNERIYTGCYMEFGYWEPSQYGTLEYTSLSNKIKDRLIEDEQFWTIISIDNWILFQSLNRIYSYNEKTDAFKIIESATKLTKMFKVDNTIYFQKLHDGLYKIENGKGQLVTNHKIVQDNTIVKVLEHNDLFLVQTQENGFFILKDGNLEPWEISAKSLLLKSSVYSSLLLSDNRFALGTISNGVIFLKPNGDLDYTINQPLGLSNNTVLSIFEDAEHNIWLGLDKGINCINTKSPFKIYIDNDGTLGTIYTSAIFNGNLFLGTNQGLFFKSFNSNDDFRLIEGTKGQVWSLVKHDGQLFCGHDSGTFLINNGKAKSISDVQGTWNILPVNDVLLQGNYDGLYVLKKKNGEWQMSHKIKGFDISSKHFDFYNDQTLFVNHEYKGVYRLKLNSDLTEVVELTNDFEVRKGLNSSLVKYQDHIWYAYQEGIFKYDEPTDKFEKDSILSQIYDDESYITGKLILDSSKDGRLWGFSKDNICYVSQGQLSNTLKINSLSLPHEIGKMMVGYENILPIGNDTYLLGTSMGYIIVDLDKIQPKDFSVTISSISNYDLSSEKQPVDKNNQAIFENSFNNFELVFNAPVYDKFSKVEYQYQLEGLYDEWSEWSKEAHVLFKNLPHGEYTFNLKARSGKTLAQNMPSYSFTIKKPWYLTNVMVLFYTIGFILLIIAVHNIYKAYYKKQKKQLMLQNQKDMELKELESQQQLMHLKNEKLQQDVDNKNRELAISTMSLIKKNEFLSGIKEELKNVNKNNTLKPVIKIIDKNLNNTDDWKFFQEAFNNADKDFLKKVKAKHPKLTPNDLKLCAYLRLNLSSKEIAPLLNISPRSVEVKRYRLRKKMDLPHESSLTNYILEI